MSTISSPTNWHSDQNIAVIGTRGVPTVQGGIEKHCEELYPRIARNNGHITIIGRKRYTKLFPYEYKGIRVIPIWSPFSKILENIVHTGLCCIWLKAHANLYSIVHIHAIGPSLFTPILRLLGFKVIVTNHGPDYNRQKWGRLAKCMLKISEYIGCKTAHRIIAVSRQIRKDLKQKYDIEAFYIPNGVDRADIIPAGETLLHFGLKAKQYVIGVGRLVPEKGFDDLIDSFKRINTDWKLVIVGAADHEDDYSRALKAKASDSKNIIMADFQRGRAIGELYSNAGLFVLPSYHEGLPIVALEAMSYNLPMLLSDIPANREVASSGETFPVGDVNALAEKIARFIEDPSAFFNKEFFKNRHKRLKANFNWAIIAKKTEDVYASLRS